MKVASWKTWLLGTPEGTSEQEESEQPKVHLCISGCVHSSWLPAHSGVSMLPPSQQQQQQQPPQLTSVQTLIGFVNTRADKSGCAGGWGAGVPVPAQPGARNSRRGVPQQLVLHAPCRRGGRRSAEEQPCVLPSEVPQQVSMWPPKPSDSLHAFIAAGALQEVQPLSSILFKCPNLWVPGLHSPT